jgi:DNA-directed RNA polymerase subunit RPC12/RpoP
VPAAIAATPGNSAPSAASLSLPQAQPPVGLAPAAIAGTPENSAPNVVSLSLKERSMDIKRYQCPNCGKTVKFDGSAQNVKCRHCNAELEITALADYQKEVESQAKDRLDWKTDSGVTWEEVDLGDLSAGPCPSCEAEFIGDKNTIDMVCPCCGNARIVQKRVRMLKPDYCIPFNLEKKSAVEALKQFCDGKRLLPDSFKKENCIENIQGMYTPFWLFEAKAQARVRFKAAKVNSYDDEDFDYTKTDYYSVVRDGSLNFEKIPVNGSDKMDKAYMDAIEPFDFAQMPNFQGECLAGYSVQKYNVDVAAGKEKANERIKNSIEKEFVSSVTGYSTVEVESSAVNIENGRISYALLPLWILNTKYNDKNYQLIMNAQTGKFTGKLPVDKGKAIKFGLMFTAIFGTVFTTVIQLLRIFL